MISKIPRLPRIPRKFSLDKQIQFFYRNRPTLIKALIYLGVSILIIFIIFYPRQDILSTKHQPGEIAPKTIRMLRDVEVQDLLTTQQHQKMVAEQTPEVYDFAPELEAQLSKQLSDFFSQMRELYQIVPAHPEAITVPKAFAKEREEELLSSLGVELSQSEIDLLVKFRFSQEILTRAQQVLKKIYAQPVVIDKTLLEKAQARGIMARNIKTGQQAPITDFSTIRDLSAARKELNQLVQQEFSGYPFDLKRLMEKILGVLLQPNLTFNQLETEKAREQAIARVKPVYFKLKKGEVIVRKGDRISEEQWKKLIALEKKRTPFESWLLIMGLLILLWLSQYFVYHFAEKNIKKFRLDSRDLAFLSLLLVISLAGLKLIEFLGNNLRESLGLPDGINFYYLAGLAGSAMLVRMMLNSETAIVYSFLLSGGSGLVAGFDYYPTIYFLVGSIVSASEVGTCEQRGKIFRAGIYLGLVSLILAISFSMLQNTLRDQELLIYNSLFAFSGGMVAAIVVTGVTPIVESIFGYTTNIKFLELLNQEHPLLKQLSLKASGTLQHSLLTANLAEAGAEAIGANPILVRVMAMYHDIGKLEKPEYFAENQRDEKNPHLKLRPTMSVLILSNHVKEGVGIAKRYKLPQEVIDGIQQHHGTSLIKFFYEKAKEMENPEIDTINEQDFRYGGPKPQTREAGILLLADIVESSARTIRDPNPAKIQGMVQNMINRVFIDGQLDECELTLKNLHQIAKAFIKVLYAMYHTRPDYPEPVEKGVFGVEKKDASTNHGREPAESKNNKKTSNGKSKEVIKRLGCEEKARTGT